MADKETPDLKQLANVNGLKSMKSLWLHLESRNLKESGPKREKESKKEDCQ